MHLVKYLLVYFLLYLRNSSASQHDFNPYNVLGVSRTATDKDIRQAYKKLAKHWHPDKNSEPNAHEQFTKITTAYEILSDSTKRQNYDEYGTTTQDSQRGVNTNHLRDPYDIFRAHFGGDFHFFHETPPGAKKIIHSREFLSNILPNSDKKPYVLFGSTNFCLHCRQPLEVFRSMERQFNEVGIHTAEFNVNDQRLSGELGILHAPSLCVISQHRVYHFTGQYTETNIKEFVRKSMPIKRYIQTLQTPEEILSLIATYNQSNRIHAILLTKQKTATLKFIIPCLQHLSRIQCAIFNSSVIMTTNQVPTFLKQLSPTSDTIFLFKEEKTPVLVIKDNDLTFVNIQKIFESNQLLHLPTITSPNVFNLVCQTNSAKPCFLIIGDSSLFEQHRLSFLALAKEFSQQFGSRMAYLDCSLTKQIGFGKIFSSIYRPNEKKLFIVVVRRWFDDTIELVNTEIEFDEASLNEFKSQTLADIEANLKLFLTTRWQNAKKFTLPAIFNFEQRTEDIFTIISNQIQDKWNYWFERNPILRSLSGYLLTYQFWLIPLSIIGYIWYTKQEVDNHSNQQSKQSRKPSTSPPMTTTTTTTSAKRSNEVYRESTNTVKLNEFNETLLQHHVSPGAPNVIILLLIAEKPTDACITHFIRQISLIKDSRMIFAVLYREYSARWLRELCVNIEDDQNRQAVRFVSSTVLALYIRRKFFVPYWSSSSNNEDISDETGAFLGMDNHHYRSSSTSSTDSIASTTDSLSFSDWIDLLFDGNIRTPIAITEWPMIFC